MGVSMRNAVKVKNLNIGDGIPKICVPITGKTKEEIISEAEKFKLHPIDLVEWRVDFFEKALDTDKVLDILDPLILALDGLPLLFTFRTAGEGGNAQISIEEYTELNIKAAQTGFVDLVDIEVYFDEMNMKNLIDRIQSNNVKIIGSNHNFSKTPSKDDMVQRLCYMQQLGADICKIAVMPQSKADLLTLLDATLTINEQYPKTPVITMSMSDIGLLSRLSGEIFGSAITFGTIDKASAPGQIPVAQLKEVLDIIHANSHNLV